MSNDVVSSCCFSINRFYLTLSMGLRMYVIEFSKYFIFTLKHIKYISCITVYIF